MSRDRPVLDSTIEGRMSKDLAEARNNTVLVQEPEDLGPVENGRHQLDSMTAYQFDGFITSQFGIELNDVNPLVGIHGGIDGFICTGGGPAIYGRDANYLQRDMYVHAPAGQILDIAGDNGENGDEVLIESVSASNAAGIGNAADLGVVDGMRVPSFKGVNFEDFNAGLTLTGTSDKVFFSEGPFRTVTENGVRILEFDAGFETEIIDIADSYVKQVQADTEVIYVDPAASITEQFQYRGTTHGPSVNPDNILNGAADKDQEPYWISDSYPLADTAVYGGYGIDATGAITIGAQAGSETDAGAYEPVDLATSATNLARFEHTSPNQIEYVGKRDRTLEFNIGVTAQTGNDEVLALALFNGGSLLGDSPSRFTVSSTLFGVSGVAGNGGSTVIVENVAQNETFDVRIANLGSATNADVSEMTLDVSTA